MTRSVWLLLGVLITPLEATAAPQVQTALIGDLQYFPERSRSAEVLALREVAISARISGGVQNILAETGDRVQSGQTLVELDCADLQLEQKRLQAGLKRLNASSELAVSQLERAEELLRARSISRDELDQRRTTLEAAKASIDEQQALLEANRSTINKCQVKAPFAGVITRREVQRGMWVNPGESMFTLLAPEKVELEASLPLDLSAELQTAQPLRWRDELGREYPLSLRLTLPEIDSSSQQQRLRFEFSQPSPLAGTRGQLLWQSPQAYLATRYVLRRDKQLGVLSVQNHKTVFVPIEGSEEGRDSAIKLDPKLRIITKDMDTLQSGIEVEIE